jgi:hypothetical protein
MGAQTEKDVWDKAQILGELITGIVSGIILVAIPIVISVGADKISRSLQTGQLVDSLIEDLTDEAAITRRDIALIALDEAISTQQECTFLVWGTCQPDETQPDQVAEIATILLKQEIQDSVSEVGTVNRESLNASEVIPILKRRKPQEWGNLEARMNTLIAEALNTNVRDKVRSEADLAATPSPERAAQVQQSSAVIGSIQTSVEEAATSSNSQPTTPSFEGVRLVYIQYEQDKGAAEKIRQLLQDQGISAPGIEQVIGIPGSSIRYSGDGAFDAAKELQRFLQNQGISSVELIDLSSNYQVSPGQFEIWLAE